MPHLDCIDPSRSEKQLFFSIFRDLHNLHVLAALHIQHFRIMSSIVLMDVSGMCGRVVESEYENAILRHSPTPQILSGEIDADAPSRAISGPIDHFEQR